jgi:hypothetical protein
MVFKDGKGSIKECNRIAYRSITVMVSDIISKETKIKVYGNGIFNLNV